MNEEAHQVTAEEAQERAIEIEAKKLERKRQREEKKLERIRKRKKYFIEKFIAVVVLAITVLVSFLLKIIFEQS